MPLRSDDSFRRRTQPEHHQPGSFDIPAVLEYTEIDLVFGVIIDGMHVVDLGAFKKVLRLLLERPITFKYPCQLSDESRDILERKYLLSRKFFPSEIQRKPRTLSELKSFKASECRVFMIYLGNYLFQDLASELVLHLIRLLSTAVRILSAEEFCRQLQYLKLAQTMLEDFVKVFKLLFPDRLSYVIHELLHVTVDVALHGPLLSFSAYPFESFLRTILFNIHVKNDSELKQLQNRFTESGFLEKNPEKKVGLAGKPDADGVFKEYWCLTGQRLRADSADQFVRVNLNGKKIPCIVRGFFKTDEEVLLRFSRFQRFKGAYSVETSQGLFDVGQIGVIIADNIEPEIHFCKVDQIIQKYFAIEEDAQKFLLQPFSHEM